MSREERKASVYTALSVLHVAEPSYRKRGKGARQRFKYCLPLIGEVCREAFLAVYGISTFALTTYRNRIIQGAFNPLVHGNQGNHNAHRVDLKWLKAWFEDYAEVNGEVVPLRVRRQKTVDGRVMKYVSSEKFTLLPTSNTWQTLYEAMSSAPDKPPDRHLPSEDFFRRLLLKHCSHIRIRTKQKNVCDICAIYKARMQSDPSINTTELLGRHTATAEAMRYSNSC